MMKNLPFLLLFLSFSVFVFSEAIARKAEDHHYKKPHYRTPKKYDYHHHKLPKHLHRDRAGHHGNHDDKHSSQHHLDNEEAKMHAKATFGHAPFFVSHQEARLQSDLSATKKSARDHHRMDDPHHDMHLQDLTFQVPEHKSPHHFQRGHHRVSHHPFSSHRDEGTKQHHREGHHKMIFEFQDDGKPRAREFHHSVPVSSLHETLSEGRHHNPSRKTEHERPMSKKAFDKGKKATSKKDAKKHLRAKKHYDW